MSGPATHGPASCAGAAWWAAKIERWVAATSALLGRREDLVPFGGSVVQRLLGALLSLHHGAGGHARRQRGDVVLQVGVELLLNGNAPWALEHHCNVAGSEIGALLLLAVAEDARHRDLVLVDQVHIPLDRLHARGAVEDR